MPELVVVFDTTTGRLISKQAGSTHIADAAIVSGKLGAGAVISGAIASGQVGTPHIAAGAIVSSLVGANVLATPHFANQGILSASIGANVLAAPHIQNQGLLSANLGANVLATPHLANQGILSASIGGGAIGATHILSASITEAQLVSGISIDIAEMTQEPSFRAAISGIQPYEAVTFTLSGYFEWARAAQSGRAPAVGLMLSGVFSGIVGAFQPTGRITNTGWNFSGYAGDVVFLGTSSEVTRTPPSASGNTVQRLGQVIAAQTVMLMPDMYYIQVGQ